MADTDIEAILRQQLQTRIIEVLQGTPEMIEAMVKAALSKPVDPHSGRPDGYGTRIPYLEYLTGEVIREAARKSVMSQIEEMREQIDGIVREHIKGDDFVKAISSAFLKAAEDEWRIRVSFEREERR